MGELFKNLNVTEAFEKLISYINRISIKLNPYLIYISSMISLMAFPDFSTLTIIEDISKGVLTSIVSDNIKKFLKKKSLMKKS